MAHILCSVFKLFDLYVAHVNAQMYIVFNTRFCIRLDVCNIWMYVYDTCSSQPHWTTQMRDTFCLIYLVKLTSS